MRRQWKLLSVAMAAMITGSLLTGLVLSLPRGIGTSDLYAQQVAEARAAQGDLRTAQDLSSSFRTVAEDMRPSVVSVRSTKRARVLQGQQGLEGLPPQLRQFFEDNDLMPFGQGPGGTPRIPEQSGIGSGVIVTQEGHILTNNHVVEGADELQVQLSDGRELEATIVGTDPATDLAVLKVEATNLKPATLGDSDAIQVGDWVLAVGSPFELEQTVTAGIISAKNRYQGIVRTGNYGGFEDFLQTDAAINPGNSGGPLVNLRGEVVGINTAIVSRSGGYNGIGFAIPTGMARPVMESIIETGEVRRGFLGAEGGDVPDEIAQQYDLGTRRGAYLQRVVPGQPAAESGLRDGDIVLEVDGRPVRNWIQFRNYIASRRPNAAVQMTVLRDGQQIALDVTLGERTEELLAQMDSGRAGGGAGVFLNARVQPLDEATAQAHGFDNVDSGLLVLQVARAPGVDTGLQAGDVIIAAQGQPVGTLEDLETIRREAAEQGNPLRLTVQRGDRQELIVVD